MPKEPFKTTYPAKDAFAVSGALLNRIGSEINSETGDGRSGGVDIRRGPVTARTTPDRLIIGFAQIVDDAGDFDEPASILEREKACQETEERGAAIAPCKRTHLYLARFRAYDHGNRIWQEYGEDMPLDAGAYWEGLTYGQRVTDEIAEANTGFHTEASYQHASGPGRGAIPRYLPGDMVIAFWDPQRLMLVPVHSAPEEPSFAVFETGIESLGNDRYNTLPAATYAPTSSSVSAALQVQRSEDLADQYSICQASMPPSFYSHSWRETRHATFVLTVSHRNKISVRAMNLTPVAVAVAHTRVVVTALARCSVETYATTDAMSITTPGGSLFGPGSVKVTEDWSLRCSGSGRFFDAPQLSLDEDNAGDFLVEFRDPHDMWFVRVDVDIEFMSVDEQSSGSSSSASSPSSSRAFSSLSSNLDPCLRGLAGVPTGVGMPEYVLGLDHSGCLAWFPVSDCDESSRSSMISSQSLSSASSPSSASSQSQSSESSSLSSLSSSSTRSSQSSLSSLSSFSSTSTRSSSLWTSLGR